MNLYNGEEFLIDKDDVEWASQYTWIKSSRGYVIRQEGRKVVFLHRQIMNCPKGMVVDHINGNPMDNRKSNLRICTNDENIRNRKLNKNSTTGYKGVTFKKNNGPKKFCSRISFQRKRIQIGYFLTAKEAAIEYNKMALQLYGEFARLNILED
jgi:hypothetical protein